MFRTGEAMLPYPLMELRQVFPDHSDSFLQRALDDYTTVDAAVEAILDGLVPTVLDL